MAPKTNLPFVSSSIPPDLRQFLDRVRETLAGDTFVRRVDYLGGTVPRNPGDPPGPGPNPIPLPCGSPVTPTAPTGFRVFPGFSGFLLQWDMPEYCGHDRTEVYGLRHDGTSDDLTVKNMLGESQGVLYSHVVQRPGDYWCFWIKHVNKDDVEGPFVPAGLCGRTALDPGVLLDTLKQQITESQLYSTLGRRINLIDLPGTGLIYQNILRRTEILDLAQQVSEISVISGNRVFMAAVGSPPEEGQVCQFNGAIITEDPYTNSPITSQNTCEDAGGIWGYYGFKHGDLWYQRSNWDAPAGATEAITQLTWDGADWATSVSRTIYKQATVPAVGTKGNLWYDTSTDAQVLWHYSDGSKWQFIIDYFVNIVADSRVIDLSQARVGVCIDKSDPSHYLMSEEITRAACEAQSNHVWEPNYPVATAIKQVGVSIPEHCLINGKISSDYTDSVACGNAGGTWVADSSIGLEQQMQAQQDVNGNLYAQLSVKIDHNGFVSGFGLSSETKDGVPFSQFLIRADRFALANPTHTGLPVLDITVTTEPTYALRTEAGYPHGLEVGDLFTLQGVDSTDTKWNGTHTVTAIPDPFNLNRFLFQVVDATDTAPDATRATLSPVSVPFVVTTTDETIYGPLELLISAAGCAQMQTTTTNRVKINNTSGTEIFNSTFTVPNNNPSPGQVVSALSTLLASYMTVTLDVATGGVYLRNKSPEMLELGYIKVSWKTGTYYSEANRPERMVIPAGVYIDKAFINSATIDWAQINMATIDWLNVVRQLKANSILAGNIAVGECIQSTNFVTDSAGWRICSDGDAELNNGKFRGAIYGGSATGLTSGGYGYYLNGTNGTARFGDVDGASAPHFRVGTSSIKIAVPSGGVGVDVMNFGVTPGSCFLRSVDYSAGVSGWTINGDGSAELGTLHLRNGAVSTMGYQEVAGTLTSFGRNSWVDSHAYVKGNIVWYSSKTSLYYCYVDHTSDTASGKIPTNTSYWVPFNDPDLTSQWSSITNYGLGTKCWIESTGLVYVSIAASNTNHAPPNPTYWAQLTHFKSLAVTDEIDLSLGSSALGSIVIGRFLATTTMATGTIPYDRVVTDPDFHIRLMFRETGGDRKLLATSGYHMHCVGKTSGGDYQYEAQICDLTRMEGAKKGKVELLLAASMGSTAYDVSTSGIALVHQGLKR